MRPAASTATPRASACPPASVKSSTVSQSCACTTSLPIIVAATARSIQLGCARILPLIVSSPLFASFHNPKARQAPWGLNPPSLRPGIREFDCGKDPALPRMWNKKQKILTEANEGHEERRPKRLDHGLQDFT